MPAMIVNLENLGLDKLNGFLVFDGVNGAGKSTALTRSLNYLNSLGIQGLQTREPGATTLGKALRQLLLEQSKMTSNALTESFLFAADRAQHVAEVIQPALKRGEVVLSDRFYYSTIAFQGYGRESDPAQLITLNHLAIQNTFPDLVFLFDLEPEVGLARTLSRNSGETDKFESEQLAFHQRLRAGFLKQAAELKEKFIIIDAAKDAETVWQNIKLILDKYAAVWLAQQGQKE